MIDDDVYQLQRLYPQIYIACHTDHVRAVSTRWHISSQDSALLVHLDQNLGVSPGQLATHLGVSSSTLSAHLARLSALGYLVSERNPKDRRRRAIRLTERGAEAMSSTSVLDKNRVKQLLTKLKQGEREEALRGLALLAKAAKQLPD